MDNSRKSVKQSKAQRRKQIARQDQEIAIGQAWHILVETVTSWNKDWLLSEPVISLQARALRHVLQSHKDGYKLEHELWEEVLGLALACHAFNLSSVQVTLEEKQLLEHYEDEEIPF